MPGSIQCDTTPLVIRPVQWVLVRGGTCLYGDAMRPRAVADLLVAATPLLPAGDDRESPPATGLTWVEAAEAAAAAGGRLPTSVEWEWIAAGPGRRRYPWGDQPWTPRHAVLTGRGRNPWRPQPAGRYPLGATPEGVYDLAGNAWEWTASTVMGAGAIIRGGSYASPPLYAQTTFLNAAPAGLRSAGITVRPVREP